MDIAGHARINAKVDKYFITKEHPELNRAVCEIMSLFKVETAAGGANVTEIQPWASGLKIIPSSVLVENMADYDDKNKVKVKTKIYYYSAANAQINKVPDTFHTDVLEIENQADFSAKEDSLIIAKRLTRLNVLGLMRKITGTNPSPWGILRGVRPAKIVHKLFDEGLTKDEAINVLVGSYGVETGKAKLITNISLYQRSISISALPPKKTVSVYIGVPYCPSRCLYCSFPSYALPLDRGQVEVFLKALKLDIEAAGRIISENDLKVETIYIGGGTPTSLGLNDFRELLALTKKNFLSNCTKEFTLEAGRPDSIDSEKIEQMRSFGVTRASINPQTMQEKTLCSIRRKHTVEDTVDAFHKMRQAKIKIINMDVIAGLPGETELHMTDTMAQIEKLKPENITVHTLAIKRGSLLKTGLTERPGDEKLDLPDEATTRNMLEIADGYAVKMGMKPYYLYRQKYMTGNLENIGYAKPGTECFYNIQIIGERQSIIGIGPAAGTKVVNPLNWQLQSCYNPKDVLTYVNNLQIYINARNNLLTRLI